MNTITIKDGTEIYYKGWGTGQPVVFSHGRLSQPWNGSEMDTYADDLSELIKTLDLNGITLVGHSTSGGEVARYIGRDSIKHFAKAVLMGAVMRLAAIVTRRKRT